MWVRGLCATCNNLSGSKFDAAYADFARQVARTSTPIARALQVMPHEPPPVFFAPRLVAQCVLFGMFGINPRLRLILPETARDLAADSASLQLPTKATLRVGLTHPAARHQALLSSGVWTMRVLTERCVHFSFADVVFPPLAWFFAVDSSDNSLGPQITEPLADATEWLRFGPDRTSVDLRNLTRRFATILHPSFGPGRDEWVDLLTPEDRVAGQAVVVRGRIG
ncbi:hypothetical protein [Amycolatopsis plumensis]|uniref:Uncharacterized protein n=1 Tax=Amycolatopsis plumensis TaxID=236508 RepID=A0ABV5UC22_9PSEU